MIPAALQCRVYSPSNRKGRVSSRSLPTWIHTGMSESIGMGLGTSTPSIHVNARIAEELDIHDGDEAMFEIVEAGKFFQHEVIVQEGKDFNFDVLVHGAVRLGILSNDQTYYDDGNMQMATIPHTGNILLMPFQNMWAGEKEVRAQGKALLHFAGSCNTTKAAPAGGYGFCITEQTHPEVNVISGHGFFHNEDEISNQIKMEYEGLLEGLIWAIRMDLKTLVVCGASELIIEQCIKKEDSQIDDAILKAYHAKVMKLVGKGKKFGTNITFHHVPRDQNIHATMLAGFGVDSKSNTVVCNWDLVNKIMHHGGF